MDWGGIFNLLRTKQFRVAADFLMSKDYFDLLVELCKERYPPNPIYGNVLDRALDGTSVVFIHSS